MNLEYQKSSVKLVGKTLPFIEELDDANDFIAYCARVSNPSNQMNTLTSDKLISYCAKNNHWSIFETVNIVFEINTTRDIARQLLRHRSFSFQEFSQRYADPTQALGFTKREARLQDNKNRQNSIKIDDESDEKVWINPSNFESYTKKEAFDYLQQMVIEHALYAYETSIKLGIAKEQARCFLPEGLTMSRMYMNGTLRSWIHLIQVRQDVSTQLENREIAIMIKEELINHFPSIKDILEK